MQKSLIGMTGMGSFSRVWRAACAPELLAVPGCVQEALKGCASIIQVIKGLKERNHALHHCTWLRLVAAAGLVCC